MLSYLLIALMLLVGTIPMILESAKGRFDLFNLKNTFILYFLLQLALSGLVTLLLGVPSEIGLDPAAHPDAYVKALATSVLGLLAFQIGYYTRSGRPLRVPSLLLREWNTRRCSVLAGAYLAIGFAAFFALINTFGGLSSFLAEREAFRSGGLVGLGVLIFPATACMSIGALVYFLGGAAASSRRVKRLKVLAVLALALVPAFFMGFRSALALPVLQFMVVWNYGHRKISRLGLLIAATLMIGGFTVYGISREIPPGLNVDLNAYVDAVVHNPELAYSVVSRSKGTEVVAAVIDKLERTGDYELGWRSAVETATIIVPKLLWEDKPDAIYQRFANYFFGDDLSFSRGYDLENWSGISPTVVGEWYWHFGVAGVAIGLFLLGRVAKIAYSTFRANRSRKSVLMSYAVFFTSFSMFAESQQNYLNGLVLYGCALYASIRFLTVKSDAIAGKSAQQTRTLPPQPERTAPF